MFIINFLKKCLIFKTKTNKKKSNKIKIYIIENKYKVKKKLI